MCFQWACCSATNSPLLYRWWCRDEVYSTILICISVGTFGREAPEGRDSVEMDKYMLQSQRGTINSRFNSNTCTNKYNESSEERPTCFSHLMHIGEWEHHKWRQQCLWQFQVYHHAVRRRPLQQTEAGWLHECWWNNKTHQTVCVISELCNTSYHIIHVIK